MKIAFITTHLSDRDGWGRYSLEVVKHLLAFGIEPIVLTMQAAESSPLRGIKVISCLPQFSDLNWFTLLYSALRTRDAIKDCQAIHCLAEPFIPLALLLSHNRPLFISGVGTYLIRPFLNKRYLMLHKRALITADRVLCISNYTRSQLEVHLPDLRNLSVTNLGVDTQVFRPPTLERRVPGLIISVGAIKARKGYKYAVQAFARVLPSFPDSRYIIIGENHEPSYLAQLKDMIAQLNIAEKVTFAGSVTRDELIQWYQKASLFLLPSVNTTDSFEGFGLVFLEAAACGLPSIGSKDCGAEDAIQEGETGFLISQTDVSAISDTITELLQNNEERNRLGRNCRRYAESQDWREIAAILARYYAAS